MTSRKRFWINIAAPLLMPLFALLLGATQLIFLFPYGDWMRSLLCLPLLFAAIWVAQSSDAPHHREAGVLLLSMAMFLMLGIWSFFEQAMGHRSDPIIQHASRDIFIGLFGFIAIASLYKFDLRRIQNIP